MICTQCGSGRAEGTVMCPRCGAEQASGTGQGGGMTQRTQAGVTPPPQAGGPWGRAGAPAGQVQPFRLEDSRWTRDEQIVGAATLLLLISLFLPWYTVSGYSTFGFVSASVDSVGGHSWMWSSFIVCLAVIAFLATRGASERLRFAVPSGWARPLMGLTGLNLLLVLIAFFSKPDSGIPVSWRPAHTIVLTAEPTGNLEIPVSWGLGAYAGLVCALVAAGTVGLAVKRRGGSR